jgi:hypothetical protein
VTGSNIKRVDAEGRHRFRSSPAGNRTQRLFTLADVMRFLPANSASPTRKPSPAAAQLLRRVLARPARHAHAHQRRRMANMPFAQNLQTPSST